jgi:hypothetical protein
MPKTNGGPILNLVGDRVREIPPYILNIPPKAHPIAYRALKFPQNTNPFFGSHPNNNMSP